MASRKEHQMAEKILKPNLKHGCAEDVSTANVLTQTESAVVDVTGASHDVLPEDSVDVQAEHKTQDVIEGDEESIGLSQRKSSWFARVMNHLSGSHSKREWLLLGERVFSHPRYAMVVMVALGLCIFERYWFVMLPLAVFFTIEWVLRFWLQKESGYRNRTELIFLFFDGLATISMYVGLLMPAGLLEQGIYLRIARLFRGMYMLRMLRIFRFLTFDTLVFSLPFSLVMVGLAALAWAMPSIGLYIGLILVIETSYRCYSLYRVLPSGKRRQWEVFFIAPDMFAAIALMGIIPELSSTWVLLRLARFLIMLNPLGNIWLAVKKVVARPEIRREGSMLAAMFMAFMIIGFIAIWYFYPHIDINDDGDVNAVDYAPFQVLLFVFRLMIDPGAAPTVAFTPWLTGLTVVLVLSGVFFFALVVSLGSNVMKYMLEELANSPLSAREHLLFMGYNEQAIPILHKLGQLAARLRYSFPSVWIFHDKVVDGSAQVGSWLSVREVQTGSRALIERFKLTGITQFIVFMQKQHEPDTAKIADIHHLARELDTDGLVVTDSRLPLSLSQVYEHSLAMHVVDSSSIRARMLYQMHHCSHMPELGIHMFDVVSGETGLYSMPWQFEIVASSAGAAIKHENEQLQLEPWLTNCFGLGLNVLAARRHDGTFILFSDLVKLKKDESFEGIIALGRDRILWSGILEQGFDLGMMPHENQLQTFTWPETWDLSMMFLGWHPGLPAMIEEMADRHHKLTCHVFSTGNETLLTAQMRALRDVEAKVNAAGSCVLNASIHAWDGLDTEILSKQLRGCKVIMFYPESGEDGNEDSMLELWLHEVASMLSARKEQVKWWTPPKLMVLPRMAENIESLLEAGQTYPLLDVRVGSPDAFHDVFMARQLLTQARKTQYPEEAVEDKHVYDFMDNMLGDAVLVEDVQAMHLLEEGKQPSWESVYREALRRGWMLMAYLKHEQDADAKSLFHALDGVFPLRSGHVGNMQLLAGSPVMEMDVPNQTASFLFCRRGVLNNEDTDTVEDMDTQDLCKEANEKVNAVDTTQTAMVSEDVAVIEQVEEVQKEKVEEQNQETQSVAVIDAVVEGEVMSESIWPKQVDKRLLRVLEKQVQGSVELLATSSEEGLVKLMDILDMGVTPEVEAKLMEALTDLQNIDRVSQRLNNVKSCLSEWAEAQPEATEKAVWEEEVAKRYVMEEERIVLRGEL
ncbi:MAG: hypothetical protein Q9N62_05810 [Ghiorsea sp.]|nr:hypothetical protein [Ghiorsea sp.]